MSDVLTEDIEKTEMGIPDAGEATQMVQAEATQMGMSVDCPVCHASNPPTETWCMDCGFLLDSEPVAVGEMPEATSGAKLVTSDGTREFRLKAGANIVGREEADILLSHNTVSRKHAVVTVEEGGVYVEDCGSTNGTTVDGQRMQPGERAQAKDGAEAVFGNCALRFVMPEMASAEEPPEAEAETPEQTAEAQEQPDLEPKEEQPEAEPEEEAIEAEPEPVARLVSKDGSLTFAIKAGVNTIGRREGANDIVIPDAYCSGRHADFSAEYGRFTLTDVGSTNGTLVNGERLEPNAPKEVMAGDEITLGQIAFTIEALERTSP